MAVSLGAAESLWSYERSYPWGRRFLRSKAAALAVSYVEIESGDSELGHDEHGHEWKHNDFTLGLRADKELLLRTTLPVVVGFDKNCWKGQFDDPIVKFLR